MRRAGVPAAVAIGWTFDRGFLDQPDHLWAVALVPIAAGPRWAQGSERRPERGPAFYQ